MKIALLYLRIMKKFDPTHPEHKSYEESSKRFLASYREFRPTVKHDLIIVNCGSKEHDGMFDGVANSYANYNGGGFDCGTYQAVARTLHHDLVVGLNTHCYFWREGWLERMAMAATMFKTGIYAYTASYERNPHLRTPSIAFSPSVMRKYPLIADDRTTAVEFESGENSLTLWALRVGRPAIMVAADGFYSLPEWRKPDNIFRRGNQKNCLVWDRHTDVYAAADEATKLELEQASNMQLQ